jgi:hypothetical protein
VSAARTALRSFETEMDELLWKNTSAPGHGMQTNRRSTGKNLRSISILDLVPPTTERKTQRQTHNNGFWTLGASSILNLTAALARSENVYSLRGMMILQNLWAMMVICWERKMYLAFHHELDTMLLVGPSNFQMNDFITYLSIFIKGPMTV